MRWLPILLFALVVPPVQAHLGVHDASPPRGQTVVIDVRPLAQCEAQSVAGARCLPAAEFLDAQGRLAPWREILWLFSTARLQGQEAVIVIGDDAIDRRFVAGLLWLSGQRRVDLVERPVATLLTTGWPAGRGQARDFARGVAYTAALREREIVLPGETLPRGTLTAPDVRSALARWVEARLAGRAARVLLEAKG